MRKRKTYFIAFFTIMTMSPISAQDIQDLPFRSIPDYPPEYTPATTVARMIDALGFRYYWATEGLRDEDLSYKPSDEARSSEETINHIFGLCIAINRVITKKQIKYPEIVKMDFDQKRGLTLEVLKSASNFLHSNPETNLEDLTFQAGRTQFPFWNVINGQIADALTHVGQVVSFRRASGNSINPKVSVFTGRLSGE